MNFNDLWTTLLLGKRVSISLFGFSKAILLRKRRFQFLFYFRKYWYLRKEDSISSFGKHSYLGKEFPSNLFLLVCLKSIFSIWESFFIASFWKQLFCKLPHCEGFSYFYRIYSDSSNFSDNHFSCCWYFLCIGSWTLKKLFSTLTFIYLWLFPVCLTAT